MSGNWVFLDGCKFTLKLIFFKRIFVNLEIPSTAKDRIVYSST